MASLDTRLQNILGDRTAQVLEKSFGMTTVNELLRHYPRRYVVRGELTDISKLLPHHRQPRLKYQLIHLELHTCVGSVEVIHL